MVAFTTMGCAAYSEPCLSRTRFGKT